MVQIMKKVVFMDANLSEQERNLLSVAYKNIIGELKTILKKLNYILKKEEKRGSKNIQFLMSYKRKIEAEYIRYCQQLINLINTLLLPQASSSQNVVFFMKMKGDYYRYQSQAVEDSIKNEIMNEAEKAYKDGLKIAEKQLKSTLPVRAGIALNYSVFEF